MKHVVDRTFYTNADRLSDPRLQNPNLNLDLRCSICYIVFEANKSNNCCRHNRRLKGQLSARIQPQKGREIVEHSSSRGLLFYPEWELKFEYYCCRLGSLYAYPHREGLLHEVGRYIDIDLLLLRCKFPSSNTDLYRKKGICLQVSNVTTFEFRNHHIFQPECTSLRT